jgi:DNA-binding NarL/FixJ family response regulator
MDNTIKTLILEDSLVLGKKFSAIVNQWPEATLVAYCSTLSEALTVIKHEKIDLFISDLNLPDGSGITAIELMSTLHPHGRSVVISVLSEREVVVNAIKAGAIAYLSKDDASMNVLQSLKSVMMGHSPISVNIARHILSMVRPEPSVESDTEIKVDDHNDDKNDIKITLTADEIKILSSISEGYTYREIAKILLISHKTVPVHISNIYQKLQASHRSQAAHKAIKLGLVGK